MKSAPLLLCLGIASCVDAKAVEARTASTAAVASSTRTGSPLEKVVNLLKEMKAEIENDAKVEAKMYDKYACWCEKTSEMKAGAIEKAQDQLRSLGQSILKSKGEIAALTSEIKELDDKMEANSKMQEEATAIRRKRNEEYLAKTTEAKQALVALEKAIYVLIEATAGSALLQQGRGRTLVQTVLQTLPSTFTLKAEKVSLLSEFLDAKTTYTPQSMTVQGILKDMYETFAQDVESATLTEAQQNQDFEALIADLIADFNRMKELKSEKEEKKAEKQAVLAEQSQLYDDTEAQMRADITFFDETKDACQAKHSEWVERSTLRQEELDGIVKAINLLSTDEARELFASTIKEGKEVYTQDYDTGIDASWTPPAFMQLGHSGSVPVEGAYEVLKVKASATHSLRLAALATRVHEAKAGHFDEVIKMIDDMIQVLKEEEIADIAKRDQCKEEITQANSTILQLTWEIKCNKAKLQKLQRKIVETTEEKENTLTEIKENMKFMDDITAQRTADNAAFSKAKQDDQEAIKLLVKVRAVLAEYYSRNRIIMGPIQGSVKGLALAQQGPDFKVSNFSSPDATFSKKDSHKNEAKGVLQILTMVIEDINDEIKNDIKDEEGAQLTYEGQMKSAKDLHTKLNAKVVFLEGIIARTEEDKAEETRQMYNNEELLKDEQEYFASIKPDCDWIGKAFYERDEKRAVEMEGLVAAKAYLAGYEERAEPQLAQLNQRGTVDRFDDGAFAELNFQGLRR